MAGVSLKCGDCGALLRSVEEAQEHAELTSHDKFSESTEAVLNLVCSTCGKPCRSKTVLYSPIPTLDCCTLWNFNYFASILEFDFWGFVSGAWICNAI
jgi:DNA-directed RNA polymerase subunit RPC12/RpoP